MPKFAGFTNQALALALLLACSSVISEQERGSNADMSNAPRVAIDRPKPTFMLREREARIHGLKPFQDLVDKAPAGSLLKPPPGRYAGPVIIDKPLSIDGGGEVVIDAGDKGTVMVLNAGNSVLRGLHLTGSGDSHDTDDSCLDVRGNNNRIEYLTIDNCLFGIDLKQSSHNIVRGNTIRSKDLDLGVRGDGLRLWYSNNNLIEKNEIIDSRDMVAWYAHRNIFRENLGRRSRYSIHFMFAHDNIVEGNQFYDNAVGVYFMYTEAASPAKTSFRTRPAPRAWGSASRRRPAPSSRTTKSSIAASASAPISRHSNPTARSRCAATALLTTASASCSTAKPAATTWSTTSSRAI